MFCSKCGKEIPEGGMFCPKCGANINSNMNIQQGNKQNSSGKTIKTLIIMVAIAIVLGIGILIVIGWLSEPDYIQMVKGSTLSQYNYGETIEESLSDWFGGKVTWDSYEEDETIYVTVKGVCPYMQEIYNKDHVFIFTIVDDEHFRFEGAYDSDGNEIFTNCNNYEFKIWEQMMSIYSDVSIHELALKAAFGDQDSLQIFKNTLDSEETENTESEDEENFDEEESVYEEESTEDNYSYNGQTVQYDFLYEDAECELKISLCYQNVESGTVIVKYEDYGDEDNSLNTSGTFEECVDGTGVMYLDTGDSLQYDVDLSSDPISLTVNSEDGTEVTLLDYDWSMENAG